MKKLLKSIIIVLTVLLVANCADGRNHPQKQITTIHALRTCYLVDENARTWTRINYNGGDLETFTDRYGRRHVGFNHFNGVFVLDSEPGRAGECFRLP